MTNSSGTMRGMGEACSGVKCHSALAKRTATLGSSWQPQVASDLARDCRRRIGFLQLIDNMEAGVALGSSQKCPTPPGSASELP